MNTVTPHSECDLFPKTCEFYTLYRFDEAIYMEYTTMFLFSPEQLSDQHNNVFVHLSISFFINSVKQLLTSFASLLPVHSVHM